MINLQAKYYSNAMIQLTKTGKVEIFELLSI